MDRNELKKLLIKNNISGIFLQGANLAITSKDIDFHNDIILLEANYVKIEKDFSTGVIDYQTYNLNLNRIRASLLPTFPSSIHGNSIFCNEVP
jgi:hypothetical protein